MDIDRRIALITGGTRGLGRALVGAVLDEGWLVITDGRDATRTASLTRTFAGLTAVAGDVSDAAHRHELSAAARRLGGLDLLVNNASVLGPSPQPRLADYPLEALAEVYRINTFAPLALIQEVLPLLRPGAVIVNISSDAAVEAYPGWGGYGSAKAALDQLSAVLSCEHPQLRVYAFDPGDMATDLHQQAFPDQDISDRPAPAAVVPKLLALAGSGLPSGRYRAVDLHAAAVQA
jgi:NAD(P)-dependent dehydrogenase (short-subunit alcohol dehydrogenase family)